MRTILLTQGNPAFITGSGIPLAADKDTTIGCDMFCEAEPGKWVPANALPQGAFEAEKKNGTLTAGVFYNGKLYDQLNVLNTYHAFIASTKGIRFKPEDDHAIRALKHEIQGLIRQVQRLQIAELQAKITKLDNAKPKSVERTAKAKKTHVPRTEPERSSPFPWLPDLNRTFTGKPITTKQLEAVAIAETLMKKGFKEKEGSALDSETMASLRAMLDQKTMQKRAFTG